MLSPWPKARKLSSGNWFIQLRLGGESIPVTARTEKECIRRAQYVKAEYQAGKRKAPEPKGPTLGEAIDAYIARRDAVLSPSTIRGYKCIRKSRFSAVMAAHRQRGGPAAELLRQDAEERLGFCVVRHPRGHRATGAEGQAASDRPGRKALSGAGTDPAIHRRRTRYTCGDPCSPGPVQSAEV